MQNYSSLEEGNTRHEKALRSASAASVFNYMATVVSFFIVPVYLQGIEAIGYGHLLLLLSFVSYLALADCGVNTGLLVLVGQANGAGDSSRVRVIVNNAFILNLLAAGVAVLVGVLVYVALTIGVCIPFLGGVFVENIAYIIVGIQAAVVIFSSCIMSLAYGLQDGAWFARQQGVVRLLVMVVMAIGAILSGSVVFVLAIGLVVNLVGLLVMVGSARRKYGIYLTNLGGIDRDVVKLQCKTGFKNLSLYSCRMVRTTVPLYVIAHWGGANRVPEYSLVISLLAIVAGFLFNWSASLQSAIGAAWASGDVEWIAHAIRKTLERGVVWMSLSIIFVLGLGSPFIALWTNHKIMPDALFMISAASVALSSWVVDIFFLALIGLNRQMRIAKFEWVFLLGMLMFVLIVNAGGFGYQYVGVVVLILSLLISVPAAISGLRVLLPGVRFLPDYVDVFKVACVFSGGLASVIFARNEILVVEVTFMGVASFFAVGLIGLSVCLVLMNLLGLKKERWLGFEYSDLARKLRII